MVRTQKRSRGKQWYKGFRAEDGARVLGGDLGGVPALHHASDIAAPEAARDSAAAPEAARDSAASEASQAASKGEEEEEKGAQSGEEEIAECAMGEEEGVEGVVGGEEKGKSGARLHRPRFTLLHLKEEDVETGVSPYSPTSFMGAMRR